VLKFLEDVKIHFEDKLRLAALFSLRYETEVKSVSTVRTVLRSKAITDKDRARAAAIDELMAYAGVNKRSGDLFNNKSFFAKAARMLGSGLKGVENVFAQHRPALIDTLVAVVNQKLKPQTHPFIDAKDANSTSAALASKHDEVFVFMAGGTTYEEALHVTQFAESKDNIGGVRFVLGGSCVHSSNSFLDDVLGWVDKDITIEISAASSSASSGSSSASGGGSSSSNSSSGSSSGGVRRDQQKSGGGGGKSTRKFNG